ncbi:MAG: 50S ribosomal protein L15 [Candidatus Azambacteria bacterium GW2011_GWA2_42_9]|uniref:Large ribosomal subunit protein uL15 n=4 Tax=Candidatus Azamiibacteriota TaxID=1752741 RepID=A0A0G1BHU4_9BACT|nr:MAG: 50S ribosomal protein L15 [Candidatus Azambacteria bacterium GW2011_GWB1_42_17]KKS45871.1 MAG: 50S ribosomal protein L15 [Candidatus Azambacteria bacterium GW2011_GWA1_42_19]KKS75252.1 MAG: 50S ribosomal protein L15 [Candidatus Azambacteria bacterium GW2011_GWA2_42_9]KKS88339.1 MAG: 50S ribosomal protein L15 [Parcubacteria group bacterium GW2011_GWC1_43_11]
MQLHNIKSKHRLKKSRRIARGGKRGGYSGRGIKGQKSRAGAKIRPAVRDTMMRMPKTRGRAKHAFKSLYEKPAIFNLVDINKRFKEGEVVSPETLNLSRVKILGKGEIGKKLIFKDVLLSKSARDKITKSGGAIR